MTSPMYFGSPGSLTEIPHPRGGVQSTRVRPASLFQTASGGARTGKTLNGKRKFTLNWQQLWLDTYADLLQYDQGHMGPGPFVLHDPGQVNWLTPNQAGATSVRFGVGEFSVDECSQAVYDNFTRSAASGWGSSTSGHAWTNTGGILANHSVNGTAGQMTLHTTGTSSIMYAMTPGVYRDTSQAVTITCPTPVLNSTAGSGEIDTVLIARATDTSNNYMLFCSFQPNGFVSLYLDKVIAGVLTGLDSAIDVLAYVPGEPLRLRLETSGTTLRGRVWRPSGGASEPSVWDVQATDTLYLNGLQGVRTGANTGNLNTPLTITYDDYGMYRCDSDLIAYDNFTRTVSGSWGTADDAVHSWGSLSGAPNAYNINGTTGRMTLLGAVNTNYSAVLGTIADQDASVLLHNGCSATPTGASITSYIDLPWVDTNNMYRLAIVRTTSNTVTAELQKIIAGVTTSLDGPDTVSGVNATTTLAIRMTRDRTAANEITAAVWAAGSAESAATLVSADSTLAGSGSLKVEAFRNTSNTNTNPVITWDNVQVSYLTAPSVLESVSTPVYRGPRALLWRHNGTALQLPWLSIDPPSTVWPGIPVIAGQAIILSMQVRGGGLDAVATLTPKLIWLNAAGVPVSITSGTPVVTSTSYASMTVTGTPPTGAVYVQCKVEATSGITGAGGSSLLYFDNLQLERGSTVTEWRPGTGIFPVTVMSLNEQWPWQASDYRESPVLVLQEVGP